jgi:hypothetical protein
VGFGLDSWNNLMVGGLAIAALAAVAVGVSTYVVIKLQKAEAAAATRLSSSTN